MPNKNEPQTPFEKFLSGAFAIVGGFFGALITSSSDSSLAVAIGAGICGMVGYLIGLHTARFIAMLILIVLTMIVYSFRNAVVHAIFDVLLNG